MLSLALALIPSVARAFTPTFKSPEIIAARENSLLPSSVVTADLNNDSIVDVVYCGDFFTGELGGRLDYIAGLGEGQFDPPVRIAADAELNTILCQELVALDYTQDGLPDLILGSLHHSSDVDFDGMTVLLENLGNFTFGPPQRIDDDQRVERILTGYFSNPGNIEEYAFILTEREDDDDEAVSHIGAYWVKAVESNPASLEIGDRRFEVGSDFDDPTDFAVADFDADGYDDLVILENDGSGGIWYCHNGGESVDAADEVGRFDCVDEVLDVQLSTSLNMGIAAGDIDGDGMPDLVWFDTRTSDNGNGVISLIQGGDFAIWWARNTGVSGSSGHPFSSPEEIYDLCTVTFSGDCLQVLPLRRIRAAPLYVGAPRASIIAVSNRQLLVLPNLGDSDGNGTIDFDEAQLIEYYDSGTGFYASVALDDMNNDGYLDIVLLPDVSGAASNADVSYFEQERAFFVCR